MPEPVLLLRLEGPLQSWGSRARWDVRDTQPEPTKSGVMGLLGCALGYPMYDPRLETDLDAGLRFGVRVESAGTVMEDYQTITDFLPQANGGVRKSGAGAEARPATIISPRFYLEDAAFLVALTETGRAVGVLERCAAAVQRPEWPVFLGRKACVPTRPVFEALSREYESLEDALARHPWSRLARGMALRRRESEQLLAYVEDEGGELRRQDAIRTNAARQYGFRQVRRLDGVTPPTAEEGDAA